MTWKRLLGESSETKSNSSQGSDERVSMSSQAFAKFNQIDEVVRKSSMDGGLQPAQRDSGSWQRDERGAWINPAKPQQTQEPQNTGISIVVDKDARRPAPSSAHLPARHHQKILSPSRDRANTVQQPTRATLSLNSLPVMQAKGPRKKRVRPSIQAILNSEGQMQVVGGKMPNATEALAAARRASLDVIEGSFSELSDTNSDNDAGGAAGGGPGGGNLAVPSTSSSSEQQPSEQASTNTPTGSVGSNPKMSKERIHKLFRKAGRVTAMAAGFEKGRKDKEFKPKYEYSLAMFIPHIKDANLIAPTSKSALKTVIADVLATKGVQLSDISFDSYETLEGDPPGLEVHFCSKRGALGSDVSLHERALNSAVQNSTFQAKLQQILQNSMVSQQVCPLRFRKVSNVVHGGPPSVKVVLLGTDMSEMSSLVQSMALALTDILEPIGVQLGEHALYDSVNPRPQRKFSKKEGNTLLEGEVEIEFALAGSSSSAQNVRVANDAVASAIADLSLLDAMAKYKIRPGISPKGERSRMSRWRFSQGSERWSRSGDEEKGVIARVV
eukprot:CAMPEP_0175127580 /NCGR_PEP_ID=MMETSP0087-20121206/4461_1 /TAXON_ID=136419 /ORGANISM="Unknown Unknown, Strain D1" /LENGTH=554 /DNA_ID=CAMNT_0016409565 /DNA_START=17 /DNA_END=1678 /DNA_ORIENTATION=-